MNISDTNHLPGSGQALPTYSYRQCDMAGCTNPGIVQWQGNTWYCGIHIRAITGQ